MSHIKIPKTNAMRILDGAKIPYEIYTYEVDENDLSGTHIADCVGLPYETVFKTLVAKGDKTGFLVFCIPETVKLICGKPQAKQETSGSRCYT